MKQKKNSVQTLIGFECFTRYGIRTDKADFVFFRIEPVNISVLSAAAVETKIRRLMTLLSTVPDLELIALDNCECFDSNKIYVKQRLSEETNEAVRKLLLADYRFLDAIQTEMSSARQFLFVQRLPREKEEQALGQINRTEKAIAEHGFQFRRMDRAERKRMLALYFGTCIEGDTISDTDGAEYFREEMNADA